MTTSEIAKRLSAVERDLAALKQSRGGKGKRHPVQALEKIHGTFENDEAFQQAMRLGRQWRNSDRKSKAKRK